MRILVIHSFYRASLPSGENEVVLQQLDLLRKHGHEVELWGPQSSDSMSTSTIVNTGLNVLRGKGADPSIAIGKFRPDIVHVHNLFPNISLQWASRCEMPIVLSIHNYRAICANGVLFRDGHACTECLQVGGGARAVYHRCYKSSALATTAVLAYQRHIKQLIRNDIQLLIYTSDASRRLLDPQLHQPNSALIPNFVPPLRGLETRSSTSNEGYFVVVGRLTAEKGIRDLLALWPSDRRLVVIGEGPERGDLESLSRDLDVSFTGFLRAERRDALIRGASALVLPSLAREVDPVVVAQALSAGTPCVVNSATSSADLAEITNVVQAYSDGVELDRALDRVSIPGISRAAQDFYLDTWSAQAWLAKYDARVLSLAT